MSRAPLHVVAGILRNDAGEVLVARRPPGAHLAGTWEFPGGKVEAGEDAPAALRRELGEELGIEVGAVERCIAVPWRYADKSILLDTWHVRDYRGTPQPREHDALAWHAPPTLAALAMPAADRPIVTALRLPSCYAITPPLGDDHARVDAAIDAAMARGVRLVSLRARELPASMRETWVRRMAPRVRAQGGQLLVHGDIALAKCGLVDGVHLSGRDLMAADLAPRGAGWVAASCHDDAEVEQANALGVDFIVIGPVLATASHLGAAPLGWERFAQLTARAAMPVFALGGLTEADVPVAIAHGAQGVAGISAFFPALR